MTEDSNLKVLANGAVYDMTAKKIVKGAALTSADAASLAAKKIDKRRAIAKQAANQAVERADYHTAFGDLAFLAALVETAMIKATTPDDPKAIEAGRFVLQATGEAETPGQSADVPVAEMRGLLRDLADLARAIGPGADQADYVDGQTVGE